MKIETESNISHEILIHESDIDLTLTLVTYHNIDLICG